MAKLPRFRKGGIGGLEFSQLNAAMNELDRGSEAIEESAAKREPDPQSRPVKLMLVYAEREANPPGPGGVAKYTWAEVILRGDYDGRPASLPVDELVDPNEDQDYETLFQQGQYRFGNSFDDNYAISSDPGFESGFCLCAVGRRSDGKKSYILVPGGTSTSGSLFYVTEPDITGEPGPIVAPDENTEPGAPGEYAWGFQDIKSVQHRGYVFGIRFLESGYPVIEAGDTMICVDFSIMNENLPDANETDVDATVGMMFPLVKPGTVLSVDVLSAPEGAAIGQTAIDSGKLAVARPYMPRITVFCEGLAP